MYILRLESGYISIMFGKLTGSSTKILSRAFRSSCRRPNQTVIGIDLGTTNSAVAVVEGDQPKILENEEGGRTTPSIVAFKGGNTHDVLVGLPAKRQSAVNSANTFFATKRLIGRKFKDDEVQKDLKNIPYSIVEHTNGDAWVQTSKGSMLPPTQISGFILKKMKEIAESQINKKIKHAVVTVPAYFNDSQRQATKNAGKLADLDILRVINEPTAAALAYGVNKAQKDGTIAVYDLGGGTFDISILEIEGGVFEVRATNGNTHLGGEDFDLILLNHIIERFKNENGGLDILKDAMKVQRVKEAAEKCKIQLSHVKEAEISIPFITADRHVKMKITEDELDNMTLHLIEKTISPVKKCIKDAGIKAKDVDEILMVGGMTRMPKIRKVVKQLFGKNPNTSINPDEAVALGAAIQGAILSGQIKDVVLLDVTPLTLGIETYGGIFSPLIMRNSPVPTKKEQIFSTAVDGQTGVDIRVYQGERQLVKDNKLIGKFRLGNIPYGPKGTPQIAVSFEIDADGIINVTAADRTPYPIDSENYGKENTVSIQVAADTGLTEEEIQKMISESLKNEEKDKEMKQNLENATRAEIVCIDTENALAQFGSSMEEDEREQIDEKLKDLRQMIEDVRQFKKIHSIQTIRDKVTEMQTLCLKAIQTVVLKQNLLQNIEKQKKNE